MDLGNTDNMIETPQQAMKINTHPTTAQHMNMFPVMLVISESLFTFLMDVCFDGSL